MYGAIEQHWMIIVGKVERALATPAAIPMSRTINIPGPQALQFRFQ